MPQQSVIVTEAEIKLLNRWVESLPSSDLEIETVTLSDESETIYRRVMITYPSGVKPPLGFVPFSLRTLTEYTPQQEKLDCALLTAFASDVFKGEVNVTSALTSSEGGVDDHNITLTFYQDPLTPFWIPPEMWTLFAQVLAGVPRDGSMVLISTSELTPLFLRLVEEPSESFKHPSLNVWYGPRPIDFEDWPTLLQEVFIAPSDPRFRLLLRAFEIKPWRFPPPAPMEGKDLVSSSDIVSERKEMKVGEMDVYFQGEPGFTKVWLLQAYQELLAGRIPILTLYEAVPVGFSSLAIGQHAVEDALSEIKSPWVGDLKYSPKLLLLDLDSIPVDELRFDFGAQSWDADQVLQISLPINSRQMLRDLIQALPPLDRFRIRTFDSHHSASRYIEELEGQGYQPRLHEDEIYAVTWEE